MLIFLPQPKMNGAAQAFGDRAALGVVEERSRAGAFEQNSALALFCADLASTAEQGRRPRRLRLRSDAKRLRAATFTNDFSPEPKLLTP